MSSQKKDLNNMRLDKFLCTCGLGTRSEVIRLIKDSIVYVNDVLVKDKDYKVNELTDIVKVNDKVIIYEKYHYVMLHKPKGYVTSTKDIDPTVMELVTEFSKYGVVPVGRLDKDTEGLLFFTNDGALAHNLTSPKKHVEKTYFVELLNPFSDIYIKDFSEGIVIDDGYKTLPSKLSIIDDHHVYLTIMEGKFHQVKRMMEAINNKVVYLKRVSFGPLILDDNLTVGTCRKLTKEEVELLIKHTK